MDAQRRQLNKTILTLASLGSTQLLSGCSSGQGGSESISRSELDLSMKEFIFDIPKAESHVHLPGCVTPQLLLSLSARNGIELPYKTPEDVELFIENSYGPDLSDFITVLDQISSVLRTAEDYYDTTYDYLSRSAQQNVKYIEAYFGPQFALENNLPAAEQLEGMNLALRDARRDFDIDGKWIMSFRRDRPVEEAMNILVESENHRENVVGVALSELDTPDYPQRFKQVFDHAHQMGYRRTTHVDVGEADAVERIWSAIGDLRVDGRIDHGIDGLADERFVNHIREANLTLAVCPTLFFNKTPNDSAYFRQVCDAAKFMLDNDLNVTLNTDDPGIFDLNYLADIYLLAQQYLGLTRSEITKLARNSFEILWIDDDAKDEYLSLQNFDKTA